jgi:aminocarboxymuconate-semialdehyde decarboxylase
MAEAIWPHIPAAWITPGALVLPHPPTHYLKKIYVDSVVFTAHQLAGLIETFGADHILTGTDYPFDMAEADPLAHLASVPGLPNSTIAAIAGGTAKRLLGI